MSIARFLSEKSCLGGDEPRREVIGGGPPRGELLKGGEPPGVLRNGSADDRPLLKVLQAQQDRQRPFEFVVEMYLVAAEPLSLSGIELTERLLADERPVGQFLLARLEPRQHLALEKAAQSLGVGGERFLVLFQLRAVA